MPRDADGGPAPPLLTWAAAAALAGSAVFALWVSPYWPARSLSLLTADLTGQALAWPPRDDIRVIGLGTSLLRTATPQSKRGVDGAGRPLSWARITKSNWGPGYLRASLTVVEKSPPDIVVIEKNLLMAEPEDTEANTERPDLMHILKQLAPGAKGDADPRLALRARKLQQLPCPAPAAPLSPEQMAQRQRELANAYRLAPDSTLVAPLLRLAGSGTRVMILDIPRSPAIEVATAADKQRWFARVRQLLPPGPNLSYHTGPSYAESRLYCDASHLNTEGNQQFQQWWWPELLVASQGR